MSLAPSRVEFSTTQNSAGSSDLHPATGLPSNLSSGSTGSNKDHDDNSPNLIAPIAFFSLLVELQSKKQSLYKAFPRHRSTQFVCRLQNKTLLGGKDYKKDFGNIQSLILKHFIIIEHLHIKFQEILSEYTGFILGIQDEPALQSYLGRSSQLRSKYCPPTIPTQHLDWSILPPDPLNVDSQRWLSKSLQSAQNDFAIFHRPSSCFDKDEMTHILTSIFTTLLPSTYQLIYYLKRQCFYMVEEVLILRSLLQETFRFTLQTEYPEVSIDILLTDWNDRFLARNERQELQYLESFKKDGKFIQDKYNKDVLSNGLVVPNDNSFWTVKTLALSKELGGLAIRSHIISNFDELRLQLPQEYEIIDLEKFMAEIKTVTPQQDKWLRESYPRTWAYVDRPPLPTIKPLRGFQ